jgi:hypothetical protein
VTRHELTDAIAEADSLDPGWRFEDLETQRQLPPANQNAALQVLVVDRLLPRPWPGLPPGQVEVDSDSTVDPITVVPERQLDQRQIRLLQRDLKRAENALAQARRLTDMPDGRYGVTWAADVISTPDPCPALYPVRKLLIYDALLRNQQADADGALLSARAVINLGRSLGDEPFFNGPRARNGCRFEFAGLVRRSLAQGEPSDIALAALQKVVEQEDAAPLLLSHFRGQRAFWHVFLSRVDRGQNRLSELSCVPARGLRAEVETWFGGLNAVQVHARYLRGMNEAVEIAKLPLEKQHPQYKRWRNEWGRVDKVGDGLSLVAGPWHEDALLLGHAELRCITVALAAERFRLNHGRWPKVPTDLVPDYLKAVPLDPFDAKPLRYRRTDDGVIIYSVGEDGQDDGGDASPRQREYYSSPADIVFTLWNIDQRRQPPKPKS